MAFILGAVPLSEIPAITADKITVSTSPPAKTFPVLLNFSIHKKRGPEPNRKAIRSVQNIENKRNTESDNQTIFK